MIKSRITGIGHYVPERVVTNDDLAQLMTTNDEWITERTGIKERRHVEPNKGITSTDLGVVAAKNALADADLTPKDIDFIIFATLSPDYYFPGNGVLLQRELGCDTIGAMDIRNQCSGFVYALATANAFIQAGQYKNILVVGAEVHSFGLDYSDDGRNVSVIFGDGAGAVILSASDDPNRGILNTNLHSEGEFAEELAVLFPGTKFGWSDVLLEKDHFLTKKEIYPYMNGNYVFKHAVTRFPESIEEALKAADKTPEDLDLFIPHQANLRIAQFIQKQLNLPDEKIFNNIQKYGNTTAASIPIALSEAKQAGKIKEGDLVLLTAFGSGFTWGSVLMNW
ncbi:MULTISPECIES: 3-oxoacyl-ACP synthase III family protein [Weeksella]|uniref:Beta-ketoacyl-[acyl-carrier-protein] synthase III n=1 Tax=Weeksella virosa (strain ATCC 43766 / DSM 16922 / JCM 21250 / CCUG 30538 / CDC 9751 / IAM 14551 / NBRC 16016 / NCTC 11634 / CL345/78) TaxID=865938 RepID=F0NZK8_WEEVC|nr:MULTISPECIES: beta-ketoacyl-ACP synthase III [Weeksella]ADX68355.1 3-oxoacyl-(acyl-carrier-protein) synthase 3 [Weeksella virosa DSM 16922]MDK7674687.1 beta-ketoacyl-ACP synthase III [Weeksella virosa]OFM83140.1 3-oxoacyl-ACP synthase [Weeksella sp. HMSC059D05]VEH64002.1 3-oxoacyl-[acyl-carrier-protein] synthase 3 [Weeksella virosa]